MLVEINNKRRKRQVGTMGEARAALQPPVTVAGARPGVRRSGGGAGREPGWLQVAPPNPGSTLTSCLWPRAGIRSQGAPSHDPPALLQPNWLVNNAPIAYTVQEFFFPL